MKKEAKKTPIRRSRPVDPSKGRCEYCPGPIRKERISYVLRHGENYTLFEGVPAGVCRGCGARYFEAGVVKQMHSVIKRTARNGRAIRMPIVKYPA